MAQKINPQDEQKKYDKALKNKENELGNIGQRINNYKKDIGNLKSPKEKKRSSLDNLKPNKKNKKASVKIESFKPFQIQNLKRLPQTGTLYKKGNQKYLAIEYWEQFEDGSKEAERLNAKLCSI